MHRGLTYGPSGGIYIAMASLNSDLHQTKTPILDSVVFDVDQRTGFMAPEEPLTRLPALWEPWEALLDVAMGAGLQLGDKPGITKEEIDKSHLWRARVRELPIISIEGLDTPILLRRAHLTLTYLLHFYVQTLPPHAEVRIPRSISIPTLQVSAKLDIPPLLTFSDTVLYNWTYRQRGESIPTPSNIRSHTLFSGLVDEEEFYLCSARIELRGVEALELMRMTMDEIFVGDDISVKRIAGYLDTISNVIKELRELLLDVKKLCNPDKYYNDVRPWFRGEDSDINHRKWIYEGLDDYPELNPPTELSGPSAGQSSIVHVLDLFLGVDHQPVASDQPSFMSRMKLYMPHNHRLFLDHLASNPRPLREFVMTSSNSELLAAFNRAVVSLKEFRDAHMIIVTLYILGPARRAVRAVTGEVKSVPHKSLKGTGGTDLVDFLKGTRNHTKDTMIHDRV